MEFWQIVFWLIVLLAALGVWFGPENNPRWQRLNGSVLLLLLAILGAYAIGIPGLPGK